MYDDMRGTTMPSEPFWMILIDGTASCRAKHRTCMEAQDEAARLLSLPENAGRGATLLKSVAYGKLKIPPVLWREIG